MDACAETVAKTSAYLHLKMNQKEKIINSNPTAYQKTKKNLPVSKIIFPFIVC